MTQLYMGWKPNVGYVIKIVRDDNVDPLELSNDAFDQYLFNSENQNLSYAFTSEPFYFRAAELSGLASDFSLYNGQITGRKVEYSSFYDVLMFYRISKIYPELTYPPMPELRRKSLVNGRVYAGTRSVHLIIDGQAEAGYVESYQFRQQMFRVVGYYGGSTTQTLPNIYNGMLQDRFTHIAIGEWVISEASYAYKDDRAASVSFPNIWDLPADSSPMRSYTYVPDLLSGYQDDNEFIVARPGYDIYSTGIHTKIIDSNRAPALCIMAGERLNVPAGGSVTLYPPPGIVISETAVTEFMYRRVGDPWYVPGFIASGYVRNSRFALSYTVQANSVTIYNESTDPVDIRYAVTNIDRSGTSTGGVLTQFEGNDGTQNFFQIKKPGTSDPASRPNDILLDTRFPTLQIVKEGFIPLSDFWGAPAGESGQFGHRKIEVPFDSRGLIPFPKFSIVFPNCLTTPYMNLAYNYPGGWGPPSNVSMLCRVDDDKLTFWASPGNWSQRIYKDGGVDIRYDLPNPIGVRYFLRGIPRP